MSAGTLNKGVTLCRLIEQFAPAYGAHVALTGGCLYKDGERKDIDILFYQIRQVDKIDIDGLKAALEENGIKEVSGFGWLFKGKWNGIGVDMFFPEEIEGEEYGK